MLRAATETDLTSIPQLEREAGERFRALGMALVADDEPFALSELRHYLDADRAWVVESEGGIVGYLIADVVDGCGHVEQVTVSTRWAHRRIGASLIDNAAEWAAGHGLRALTLTTFRDVPWNGPYYLSLGFRWLTADEETPGLRAIRSEEIERGLDRWPRGCMRRDLR